MSGRKSKQPAISLFSFQDIVTSVTAILILIVLILSLELISRKYQDSARDPGITTATIKQSVSDLESLVARLHAEAPATEGESVLGRVVTKTNRDVRILRDQLERTANQVAEGHRVCDEARRLADAAANELRRKEREQGQMLEQEQEADELAQEVRKMAEKNSAERARLDVERRELEDRRESETELVFKRPKDTSRQPWLLEVSEAGFVALRLGSGQPKPLGSSATVGTPLADWIAQLRPSNDYVLILIRPSGIDAVSELRQKLAERNIPHGTDFIGEGQPVHDGSASSNESQGHGRPI